MTYTLGEAAKATGKSKPTIQRAIKSGIISANRNDKGSYLIDPAELHRVFPPVTSPSNKDRDLKQSETAGETALQREIELLREFLTHKDEAIADLRRRLDTEGEERRKAQSQLNAFLTDQREKPAPTPEPQPQQAANQNPRRSLWTILKRWV